MNIKETAILFIKGLAIGVANAIPGVSGGTLAFVLGIYEKLTFAISSLPSSIFKPKEFLSHLKILIPTGIGAVISIFLFLNAIVYLFGKFPVPTQMFFVGLILGSLPLISRSVVKFNIQAFFFFFIGAAVMAIFVYFDINAPAKTGATYSGNFNALYGIKLFVCGVAAASAMIIPGISGSLLLLIMGEYENVSYLVKSFEFIPLAFLGAGVALGIFAVSKLITFLLSKYRDSVFSVILGIIIVSLMSIWPSVINLNVFQLIFSVLTLSVGFALSFVMERLESDNNKTNA